MGLLEIISNKYFYIFIVNSLNKCKWDTASNTDACTAVLSIVFTPDVQNQLKTTTTVQVLHFPSIPKLIIFATKLEIKNYI